MRIPLIRTSEPFDAASWSVQHFPKLLFTSFLGDLQMATFISCTMSVLYHQRIYAKAINYRTIHQSGETKKRTQNDEEKMNNYISVSMKYFSDIYPI